MISIDTINIVTAVYKVAQGARLKAQGIKHNDDFALGNPSQPPFTKGRGYPSLLEITPAPQGSLEAKSSQRLIFLFASGSFREPQDLTREDRKQKIIALRGKATPPCYLIANCILLSKDTNPCSKPLREAYGGDAGEKIHSLCGLCV